MHASVIVWVALRKILDQVTCAYSRVTILFSVSNFVATCTNLSQRVVFIFQLFLQPPFLILRWLLAPLLLPRGSSPQSELYCTTVRTLLHRIEVLEGIQTLEQKPFSFNPKAPVYFPHLPPGLHHAVSENFDFACLFHYLYYNVAAEPEILSSEGFDSQDVPLPGVHAAPAPLTYSAPATTFAAPAPVTYAAPQQMEYIQQTQVENVQQAPVKFAAPLTYSAPQILPTTASMVADPQQYQFAAAPATTHAAPAPATYSAPATTFAAPASVTKIVSAEIFDKDDVPSLDNLLQNFGQFVRCSSSVELGPTVGSLGEFWPAD